MKGVLNAYTSNNIDHALAKPTQTRFDNLFLTPTDRKRLFLDHLRPVTGKIKYKRYVASPLRYAGGKTLAVALIVEMIPDYIRKLVSPFFGRGSVEIAVADELQIPVLGFDTFDILIHYWDVQLHDARSLYARLKLFSPTREGFKEVKDRLKLHWQQEKPLNKSELAAYYFFNSNTSYGPHLSTKTKISENDRKSQDFKAPQLHVACETFDTVIPRYRNDFLYCDPPYFLDGDSKTFIGMYPHRNFPIHHKGFKHELKPGEASPTVLGLWPQLSLHSSVWFSVGLTDSRFGGQHCDDQCAHLFLCDISLPIFSNLPQLGAHAITHFFRSSRCKASRARSRVSPSTQPWLSVSR